MHIDGGCHCGNISYEAEIDPEKVIVCHCTDCQELSGTAFRTVVFVPESQFNLLVQSQQPDPKGLEVRRIHSASRRRLDGCSNLVLR